MTAPATNDLEKAFGLSGATVIIALIAFWLGTRKGSVIANWPHGAFATACVIGAMAFLCFWLGAKNPKILGGIPVIGDALA